MVASQLVANMPLIVAFDRLIAKMCGVWYYKRGLLYSMILCASLSAPVFKLTFHSLKWICIFLAALVYSVVACSLRTNSPYNSNYLNAKRIRNANIVMGLTTINSILFHLVPDFLLVVPVSFIQLTVFLQCILFSLILEKVCPI
uniref:Uncharacterized protein n=1 Tax=Caenorhabditis japonica TaxID=281687 RepID=A0A8R1I331_CAEJA